MRIALINAPYFDPYFMENIKFVEKHLRSLPPLGLMYVSSIAKSCGHDVLIIDAVAEHLSKRTVLKKLREFGPGIIGFSVLVPVRGKLFEWMKYLRKKLSVPVVVGGNALLYYPKAILSNDFIDYASIGSAGQSFPRLLKNLENGEMKKEEGIGFKKNGKIFVNHPSSIKKNIDSLPFPDRNSLN
ncbi:MAG: cobalamin-dependent protein, partial [Thermoplasmata archaeon]|nr:cobalamin-dependent protein [Thermoplasmata archaeon]